MKRPFVKRETSARETCVNVLVRPVKRASRPVRQRASSSRFRLVGHVARQTSVKVCFISFLTIDVRSDGLQALGLGLTTSSPPTSPSASGVPPPKGGANRSAKRRERLRQAGRKVTDSRLQQLVARLRKQLGEAEARFSAERQQRETLVDEHWTLGRELERALERADSDREVAKATLNATRTSLTEECTDRLRRAETLHRLALDGFRARASADQKQLRLELDKLVTLVKRLRSERDAARIQAVQHSEARHALLRELTELRAKQSKEAVREAIKLTFPGHRAE